MKNSLEFACEDFFIRLFRADSRLSGKSFFHFDEEQKAKSNAIIVQVKQGGHTLAGPGGFELEAMVEYRAPVGTKKAQNDLVAAAMQESVYSPRSIATLAIMASEAGLSDLLIKDESTSDRQNSQDLRKRTLTLPIQAKLA